MFMQQNTVLQSGKIAFRNEKELGEDKKGKEQLKKNKEDSCL